jgi:threonylcarbamoyladenosine tRNA methylthiotransferase MtaB
LWHLVERLAALPGEFRVRLSSIEATEVTHELIRVMADHADKVAPHLHVSMQSGSDAVLRRMRRRWGSQRYVDRCLLVREKLDRPALTTDVMVGFPGETDADFEATCQAAHEVGFSKIHVFPFSPRHGTPAAQMPAQIPPPVKNERCLYLAQLERELRERYFASLLGMRLKVLVESPAADRLGHFVGTSCRYAPVELPGHEGVVLGQLTGVMARRIVHGRIWGEPLTEHLPAS